MQYAVNHGCDALLEVGPGKALAGMMKRIAPQVEVLALDAFLRPGAAHGSWSRQSGAGQAWL
jgi:malonyl CoA-acyl carrier protein transacylase